MAAQAQLTEGCASLDTATHRLTPAATSSQVAAVVVKGAAGSESKLSADLVVVGVGARPAGVELVSGQVEVVAPPVGGIKVRYEP